MVILQFPTLHYRLFELYMLMHQKLHSRSWPIKILYHVGDKEALLGWVSYGSKLRKS